MKCKDNQKKIIVKVMYDIYQNISSYITKNPSESSKQSKNELTFTGYSNLMVTAGDIFDATRDGTIRMSHDTNATPKFR